MVNNSSGMLLVFLASFLILSITPITAYNTQNLNQSYFKDYKVLNEINTTNSSNSTCINDNKHFFDDVIHVNNDIFLKIDFITFLIYQCFGIRVTVHKMEKSKDVRNILDKGLENGQKNIFIVTNKKGINFYNLIDGDTNYKIYVFEKSGKRIVTDNLKKLGCTNLVVVVNSKDTNMRKTGDILNYMINKSDEALKELYHQDNTDNSTMVENKCFNVLYDYSKWVCLNLMQFSRFTPYFIAWEELKTGMISIYLTNKTDYKSVKPALVVNKTDTNITLLDADDGKQYLLQKDRFMEIYTGISLKPIENITLSEMNMTLTTEEGLLNHLTDGKCVLSYANYLLEELFKLNLTSLDPKSNPFVNACWISIDLYKTYGIQTTIKRLSLNEVRNEYFSHKGILLLLRDDKGYFYYAPILNVYENSFDVQIGDSLVNLRDWELNYSGMVLIEEGNDNIKSIEEYSNLNLENIDPIPKKKSDKLSNAEIVREWAKANWLIIFNIGLSIVTTAAIVTGAVATVIAVKSSLTASLVGASAVGVATSSVLAPVAVGVVGVALAVAVVVGVTYGIYKLVEWGKKKHKISKLKNKYNTTKI